MQAFIDAVRNAIGDKAVVTDRQDIEPWLTDWRGRYRGEAPAMLSPANRQEVQSIVALAAEHGVPLVPQGGNTSMVGGATPPEEGSAVILSLRRMNRLPSISAEDNLAVAEAGMILSDLHDAAAAAGRRFPLTLGSRGSCTVGGLAATNAGGTQVLRFGTMRELVAGVEAVLADGSVHDGLAALKKDNRGYDLNQLLIGSEGTIGVITAVALRLVPAVAVRAVGWAGVADPQAALRLLRFFEQRTDAVEGFELIAGDSLALVLNHIPGTRAPLTGSHRWHVLIEATAADAASDPAQMLQDVLGQAMEAGMVEDATISANEAQAEAFWRIRDSISEAERAEGPTTAHDISVPIAAMPDFIVESSRTVEQAFPGAVASAFGHLGDGNVHFHVRAGSRVGPDWMAAEAPAVTRLVHDLVVAAGGSISAEHGIGQMKRDELERLAAPGDLAAMRAIKRALDPRGIFNPGKLVD
ncbi:FAD-binding oxidoreductase [Sphingomonas sinipercae]|uniref:FAD-binding oxidoreductase n=1 Tax=Sphingomonas sinipercae TaxID=2714944 RepID=A0A6G7ZQT1_9SPHN|nr:FAD-binding oxidoreductase [Sphingomonas sinipercae]QIL03293.1 FAD-binding oxidoreductase [Sphingomonas sinipercae]